MLFIKLVFIINKNIIILNTCVSIVTNLKFTDFFNIYQIFAEFILIIFMYYIMTQWGRN